MRSRHGAEPLFCIYCAPKAEKAGCRVILGRSPQISSLQTDPVAGAMRKTALSKRRRHVLPDGTVIGRDQAAAWVLWNIRARGAGGPGPRCRSVARLGEAFPLQAEFHARRTALALVDTEPADSASTCTSTRQATPA